MNLIEIILLGVFGLGLLLFWNGGGMLLYSRGQLRKRRDFTVVKRKMDANLETLVSGKNEYQRYLFTLVRKLNMWSVIGAKKPLSLSVHLIKSGVFCVLFTFFSTIISNSIVSAILWGAVGMALPSIIFYAQFLRVTHRARRLGLMPFVDLYKNAYHLANENVITAFHICEENCPKEMRSILDWLLRRLHDGSPHREGMREFASILHSEIAHVFVNYLISGHEGEAENIRRSLAHLQIEMHVKRDEEEERDLITKGAFYFNFAVIGITLVTVFFLTQIMTSLKNFFVQSELGHALLSFALLFWIVMIIYSYLRMKGGDS